MVVNVPFLTFDPQNGAIPHEQNLHLAIATTKTRDMTTIMMIWMPGMPIMIVYQSRPH